MAEAGPSGESLSEGSITLDLSSLEIDDEDERNRKVKAWIRENAFPSMELHRQIWRKFRAGLEYDLVQSRYYVITETIPPSLPSDIDPDSYIKYIADILVHYQFLFRDIDRFILNPKRSITEVKTISRRFVNFIRNSGYITPGFQALNDEYNKHGFYYHYFGWVNTNFDPVAAKLNTSMINSSDTYRQTISVLVLLKQIKNRLSLTPNTFKQGFPMLSFNVYQKIIRFIQTPDESGDLSQMDMKSIGYDSSSFMINSYVGWSKTSIEDAILKSGLAIYVIDNHRYNEPSIPKSIIKLELKGKLSGLSKYRRINDLPYMLLWYYGTIYRKIFMIKPNDSELHSIYKEPIIDPGKPFLTSIYSFPPLTLEKHETTDPHKTVLDWIKTNTFPSLQLHEKILTEFEPRLKREYKRIRSEYIKLTDKEPTRISPSSSLRFPLVQLDIRYLSIMSNIPLEEKLQFSLDTLEQILEEIDLFFADYSGGNAYNIGYMITAFIRWREITSPVFQDLNTEYNRYGYYYHYFGWINTRFPPVAAKLNTMDIKLSGDLNLIFTDTEIKLLQQAKDMLPFNSSNFEAGFPTLLISDYKRILKYIEDGKVPAPMRYHSTVMVPLSKVESDVLTGGYPYSGTVYYTGWTRKSMEKAILQSGLEVDSVDGRNFTNPPVIPKSVIKHGLKGILPGFNLNRYKAGKLYILPSWYYATIYRKIFGTITNVDWEAICKNKLQKYNILKFIAVNDFELDYKYVKTLKYDELCSLLEKESEIKRQIRLEIGEEAKEIKSAIIYQPGSVFVPNPSGFAPTETTEYVPPEWQELANICAKSDSVSKGYLAFIARRMGVRKSLPKDLSSMNNDQICSMLLNYVKVLQRGKKIA